MVCPNVTGRTKKRIAQSKRARTGWLALVDYLQVAQTCILRGFGLQMPWRFFSSVTFVLFCFVFRLYAFVDEAAALPFNRPSVCWRSDSHTYFFYFFIFLRSRFSEYFSRFLLVWRVCVCVFSSHSFWTSSSLDVPAGVTQEEGHTGFLIHLLSAVRSLIFLARRIQPILSLVDREVEFCVLTI